MMTRQEFRLISLFAYLVLDALADMIRPGGAMALRWRKDRSNFINGLGDYGRENVPGK